MERLAVNFEFSLCQHLPELQQVNNAICPPAIFSFDRKIGRKASCDNDGSHIQGNFITFDIDFYIEIAKAAGLFNQFRLCIKDNAVMLANSLGQGCHYI